MSERTPQQPAEEYPGVSPEDADKFIDPLQEVAFVGHLQGRVKGPLVLVIGRHDRTTDDRAMRGESETTYRLGPDETVTCYDNEGKLGIEHEVYEPSERGPHFTSVTITKYGADTGGTWFDTSREDRMQITTDADAARDLLGLPDFLIGAAGVEFDAPNANELVRAEFPLTQGQYGAAMRLLDRCTEDMIVVPPEMPEL